MLKEIIKKLEAVIGKLSEAQAILDGDVGEPSNVEMTFIDKRDIETAAEKLLKPPAKVKDKRGKNERVKMSDDERKAKQRAAWHKWNEKQKAKKAGADKKKDLK